MFDVVFKLQPDGQWRPVVTRNGPRLGPKSIAPHMAFVATTLGWHELYGGVASLDKVLSRLRRYPLRQIVQMVSEITLALNAAPHPCNEKEHAERQNSLAKHFLGPAGVRQLQSAIRVRRDVDGDASRFAYFHERQALNALKLALIELDDDPAGHVTADLSAFVEAMLMLNDLIEPTLQLSTRHAGDSSKYREELRTLVRHAARQLDSTIELIHRGAFASEGLDPAVPRLVFPVVLLADFPVPATAYRQVLAEDLAGEPLVTKMRAGVVQPLQFLTVSELEMWESAVESQQDIAHILRQKTATEEASALPFHDYVHLTGESFQHRHSAWQRTYYGQAMAEALALFSGLGRHGASADPPTRAGE